MDRHSRLAAALRGTPVDRPPIWFMRQAGRYMEEYRAIREKVSFPELCNDADLATEVTIQPVDRFGVDAAIVFSDILTIPEAMGMELVWEPGHGPKLPSPVRSRAEVDALGQPDVADALPVVPATLRKFQRERPEVPILGFAGAPFTLLCYMVQGGGSKDWLAVKQMLFGDPETAEHLLGRLADIVGDYLQSQVDAGAAGVQMFDTWAGILSVDDYDRFALPFAQRAFARVSGAPRIYFTRDSSPFLGRLEKTGADVVGLDWRVEIPNARDVLGAMPIQGNLDPVALYAPPDDIRARVHRICDQAGPQGHVFNLGHGVLPTTPIEGVEAMVAAVKERAAQ